MGSSTQEQNASGVGCNPALTACSTKLRAHFSPTQHRLQLTLDLSQSLATVLEGDNSLARHFKIPLASDTMAGKIDALFGNIQLVKDNEGEVDNDVRWLDIVLAPTYTPERREDGYYYLQLDGRKGLIRITESDHNFIKSGLPQKLINPRYYPSDVQSEEEAMRLVEELLLDLNERASQIIDANNDCRARINQRLETLRQLSQSTQEIDDKFKNAGDLQATGPPEPARPRGVRKSKLEAAFKADFGRSRTYAAIVAAQYRARNDHGKDRAGSKRKLRADDSLPPSTANKSARVAIPDRTNPFSLASDPDASFSVSFLTPLRSLRSSGTSSGGTAERQECPESSHQTMRTEAITQDTGEGPLWNECTVSSASRADIEDLDATGTAVLHPVTERTTADGRSSGRGHQPIELCPTGTRERDVSNEDVPGTYQADNVAGSQPANPHHQFNSAAISVSTIAAESLGARSPKKGSGGDHSATIHDLPLGGNTADSTQTRCDVTGARPESRGIQPKARDDPGPTLLLPVLHQQELSPATTASAQTTNPVRRPRKPRASVKGKGSGTGCITCRRRKSVCDRRSPACNTCVKAKLSCEGYILQKPTGPEESSTPRSQENQYQQEVHGISTNSLYHVVEGDTAVIHGLPGPQHGMSVARTGSPRWMRLSGSEASLSSPSFVFGQEAPGVRGDLTAVNRLPPPMNPDTGPQVIPPIDQVLNGQYVPSNQPAFPDWSPQA
ncbi:hypothetical protein ASPCAL14869 [Aspergillus calidoustus]|uniref:Zn(2)-C6 fungal-type domain-containing protein n=1 Tax=Aspergillus calidoustus TaxID=454130 RepID=A0A0U5GKE5_ASPCI|nr:hypothetical protein ASPCAL14869 [Aspergillus calidoustus]